MFFARGEFNIFSKVAIAATDNLTPVTLELGGKDPAVILPDTELDRWISLWMRGVLYVFCCLVFLN
jgi:acyl-CoA reductase-like NAD-dependent aldehyde dehydrogenase